MASIMITKESEYLESVADYIEQHGWVQNSWTNNGRVCLIQAMGDVAGVRLSRLYMKAIDRLIPVTNGSPMSWNDTPGRTKQEVLDLLRAQAKAARVDEESHGG